MNCFPWIFLFTIFFQLVNLTAYAEEARAEEARTDEAGKSVTPGASEVAPPIDADILAPVEVRGKKAAGLRAEESEAYYYTLNQAGLHSLKSQKAAAKELEQQRRAAYRQWKDRPDIPFPVVVDIYRVPEEYQGKLVSLRGHVRRLVQYPAGENEFGIETLYEAWLYTENSQSYPVVVVTTEIPDEMPMGENLSGEVSVTGYVFKMYKYPSQNNLYRYAPMILSQRLHWKPPVKRVENKQKMVVVGIVVSIGVCLMIWFAWRMTRRDRRISARIAGNSEDIQFPSGDSLESETTTEPETTTTTDPSDFVVLPPEK